MIAVSPISPLNVDVHVKADKKHPQIKIFAKGS